MNGIGPEENSAFCQPPYSAAPVVPLASTSVAKVASVPGEATTATSSQANVTWGHFCTLASAYTGSVKAKSKFLLGS